MYIYQPFNRLKIKVLNTDALGTERLEGRTTSQLNATWPVNANVAACLVSTKHLWCENQHLTMVLLVRRLIYSIQDVKNGQKRNQEFRTQSLDFNSFIIIYAQLFSGELPMKLNYEAKSRAVSK